jgi:hypothetical protein
MSTYRPSVREYIHACEVLLKSLDLSDHEHHVVQDMARRLSEALPSAGNETA